MDDNQELEKLCRPNVMSTVQHTRRRALVTVSRIMSFVAFSSVLLQPAAAVLLTDWQNCLDDSVKYGEPRELQWSPLYLEASYEKGDVARTLRVTTWGNVSGSYGGVALPAWNSLEWDDANFTDGKIVRNPFPTTAARLTTLHDKVDVLTYEPYAADFDFCEDALTNRSCPLGPVFNTTPVYVSASLLSTCCNIYKVFSGRDWRLHYSSSVSQIWNWANYSICSARSDLPSISMSKDFYTSYAFTSFTPTL